MTDRGLRTSAAALAAFVVVVVGASSAGVLGLRASETLIDLGQLATGLSATACAAWAARAAPRAGGADARWLQLLTAGMAGWTLGQLAWTSYHLAGTPIPSPSVADVGYLSFPVFALAALLAFPTALAHDDDEPEPTRVRSGLVVVLDSLLVAGAVFLIAWVTSLGVTARMEAPTSAAFVIALLYPVTDLILVFAVILTAAFRCPAAPRTLGLLGAGVVALSMSDSSYSYLVGSGAERIPPVSDAGFVAGPALLALAALASAAHGSGGTPSSAGAAAEAGPAVTSGGHRRHASRPGQPDRADRADRARRPWPTVATIQLLLPYVPLAVVGVIVAGRWAAGAPTSVVERWTLLVLVTLVLLRQLVTIRVNLLLLRDVRAAGRDLRHQAFHDPLTGLANRQLFTERLAGAIRSHRRDRTGLAVLFCDLDDFKVVNDSLGHASGDQLLRVVGQRLRHCVGTTDLVARLGGDEFAVILDGGSDPPESVGERVLSSFRQPAVIGGHSRPVRASVGLVVAEPGGSESAQTLLRRADTAMYTAKQGGKGRLVVYRPGLSSPEVDVHLADALATALRHGPDSSGFDVHYQPIVRLGDGAVVALEALARWTDPGRGPVPPGRFVAVAEDGGLVGALDDLVLTRACGEVALAYPSSSGPRLHVNVSASRLSDDALADSVARALSGSTLDPRRLVVEITETSRIVDLDRAAETLDRIRDLGVAVALDDVGAGYSTLAALHHLPVDVVKLDRTLIANPMDSARVAALCRSMINVAHALGAVVVAEGIESPGQITELALLGCELGQGFLFARPAPLADLAVGGTAGGAVAVAGPVGGVRTPAGYPVGYPAGRAGVRADLPSQRPGGSRP